MDRMRISIVGGNQIRRINNIIKSVTDKRDYRGIVLDNELKALLVSDNECEVAAASLSLQVGQMLDPKHLSGLAHLCEHVITLGTEKYPEESSYQNFLIRNGGKSNAYTYSAMTKFYFEIAIDKLENALDRFAQFFISPQFQSSAVEQEIKVVNSEFEKKLYDDQAIIRQIQKHMSNPKHPYKNFGAGNLMTLETIPRRMNINVRDELMAFFKKWYSSNLMCLVVLGREPIDVLEGWVVEKFSKIENKKVERLNWDKQPYLPEEYGTKVYITPVKEFRSLVLCFTTDDFTMEYRSRPEDYVVHLIEHKGKGSIIAELRNRHWSNKMSASHMKVLHGFGFLEITISLTEEGLEHVDEIVQLVFEYIQLLREEGPKKWIFDEITNMNDLNFRFREKESIRSFVMYLVQSLQLCPMEEVITGPVLSLEWRPDLINNLVDSLKPSNCRILIIAKKFEPTTYEVEPIYKGKYRKEVIAKNLLNQWATCKVNKIFHLPEHNPYIPTDFTIFPKEIPLNENPVIIFDSPYLRTWFKQYVAQERPVTYMHLDFASPLVSNDSLSSNLSFLIVGIFLDSLNDVLFQLNVAGMEFTMAPTFNGLTMMLSGYTHKLFLLLKTIVGKLFEFKVDSKIFDLFKEERLRYLKNVMTEQPYKHALYCLQVLLTEKCYPNASYLDVIKVTTLRELENFTREFLNRVNIECFIYGNVNKRGAMEVSNFLKQKLEKTNSVKMPFLMKQLLPARDYKLKEGETYVFDFFTKYSKLSCTLLYLQCGQRQDTDSQLLCILAQIMDQPCRDYLRTKDLVGYVVRCDTWNTRNSAGLYVVVQTDKDPEFIEERIEKFLVYMSDVIKNLTDDVFERHKNVFRLSWIQPPKNSMQKFHLLAEEISSGLYQFNKFDLAKNIIDSLQKKDVVDFYTKYISKDSPRRRALLVYVYTPNIKQKRKYREAGSTDPYADLFSYVSLPAQDRDDGSVHHKILDIESFKASLEMYPLAKQYQNIRYKGKQMVLNYS